MTSANLTSIRSQISALRAELDALESRAVDMELREVVGTLQPFSSATRRIAAEHGLTMGEVRGGGRSHDVIPARMEIYWTGSVIYGLSLPVIGRILNRDHTSVLHGRNIVDEIFAGAFGGRAEALARSEDDRRAAILSHYRSRATHHIPVRRAASVTVLPWEEA